MDDSRSVAAGAVAGASDAVGGGRVVGGARAAGVARPVEVARAAGDDCSAGVARAADTARATEADADPDIAPMSACQTPAEAAQARRIAERRGSEPGLPRFLLTLNAGLILTAIAIVLFKAPNGFAFGGTSGLSIVLSKLFPTLPVGAFMWVINALLVVLGIIFLDRRAVGWSVFASFALSAYVSLFERLFPIHASITGDMWLDLCFAVILPALGSAIVFDIGASTGGTDILAMILRKHTSMEIGRALMAVDVAIVAAAAVLYGPRVGLYCVLGLFGKTLVVDGAIERLHLRKVCTVICSHPHEVERFIVRELDRSATITPGYGAYSGKRVLQVMSVLSRHEAMRLRLYVRSLDDHAFMTVVNSSEIIGKGFRGLN